MNELELNYLTLEAGHSFFFQKKYIRRYPASLKHNCLVSVNRINSHSEQDVLFLKKIQEAHDLQLLDISLYTVHQGYNFFDQISVLERGHASSKNFLSDMDTDQVFVSEPTRTYYRGGWKASIEAVGQAICGFPPLKVNYLQRLLYFEVPQMVVQKSQIWAERINPEKSHQVHDFSQKKMAIGLAASGLFSASRNQLFVEAVLRDGYVLRRLYRQLSVAT